MTQVPCRVIVVDDEEPGRAGIRSRLEALGGFEVVAECATGRSSIEAIRTHAPDLVFLDIHLPGLDGFDVIDEIGADRMPAVIFVTAFDQYALRAFEAHAVDYLLKPIDGRRFESAVERARRRVADAGGAEVRQRLLALVREFDATARGNAGPIRSASSDRLVAKDGNRLLLLDGPEIDWVEADGDYVRIHVGNKSVLVRDTLTRLQAELPADAYVRIHRSTMVRLAKVREVRLQQNNANLVVLKNGVTLRASRRYAEQLRAALGLV